MVYDRDLPHGISTISSALNIESWNVQNKLYVRMSHLFITLPAVTVLICIAVYNTTRENLLLGCGNRICGLLCTRSFQMQVRTRTSAVLPLCSKCQRPQWRQ